MMDIKQSFQNIVAWAKKNPWLAGGIVLLLILIAWWISKQGIGRGSSISSGALEEPEEPTLPDLGGGGGLLDSIKDQDGGITQPPPVYNAPIFDALPSIPEMQDMGYFDPGSVQDMVYSAPSVSGNVPVMQESGLISSKLSLQSYISSSPVASVKKPIVSPSPKLQSYISSSPVAAMAKPIKPKKPFSQTSGVGGGKGKTPAQLAGKSKYFTGLFQGIYYVRGYPVSSSTPGTQVGTGTISKSPVSGMKKPT